MTLSVSTQVSPIATRLIVQTTASNVADNAVAGVAATTLYMVDIDNQGGDTAYLKLYNTANAVVGTTVPDMVFMMPAGTRRTMALPEGLLFSTAISMACVTTGGTAGAVSPAGPVVVRMLASV